MRIKKQETWGTRLGLVFAMAGFAVGFGNFLRFPVQAVQNGGGAFIIPYLVSFVLIGLPVLLSEWALGRYGGQLGDHSTPFMMQRLNKRPYWKYIGVFGLFTNIIIASYYTYLESWTLYYAMESLMGSFTNQSQDFIIHFFNQYIDLSSYNLFPFESIIVFIFVLALNIYFLSRGLQKGVEFIAKWGVPLLIIFGFFLAFKAITLQKGDFGALNSGFEGLNFLWTPDYSSITDPKVWLAAAGQIFFTIGIGWGTIQCYASYLKANEDIALNAMTAGWTNEFVEVVLGAAIIIPLSIGFLGVDKLAEITGLGGLSLGFKVMPFLFGHFSPVLSALSGFFWFALLFIAGITSSLAMGSPFVSFVQTNFNFSKNKASLTYGIIIFVLAIPSILFFKQGVLDEFDYWGGTFSLFFFAMMEIILLSWLMPKNWIWQQINKGADIKIPRFFKPVIRYITPSILILIFFSAFIKPKNNDWKNAFVQLKTQQVWPLDNSSIIKYAYNAALWEKYKSADESEKNKIKKQIYLLWFSKLLIVLTFVLLSLMVKKASKSINFTKNE